MYDYLIFIGRCQPFHLGHKAVIELAFKKSKNVIFLVGSSNSHRSTRNPWTFEERKNMIEKSCHSLKTYLQNLIIEPLNDYTYNDVAWVSSVRTIIEKYATKGNERIGIIGFDKDHSTYYLKMFKGIEVEEIPSQFGTLNATQIRDQYFQEAPIISEFIPDELREYMKEFAFTPEFKWLLKEFNYIRSYRKSWENTPFPPVFVTADCLVLQSDLLLLIRRRDPPYAGALALPGGFINPNERIVDSAVRELREETKISDSHGVIPPAMLKSFISREEKFDDPNRSDRGRTITHTFLFELPKRKRMYTIKGADDAIDAQWYDLSSLRANLFMEDHAFIIQKMLGITLD